MEGQRGLTKRDEGLFCLGDVNIVASGFGGGHGGLMWFRIGGIIERSWTSFVQETSKAAMTKGSKIACAKVYSKLLRRAPKSPNLLPWLPFLEPRRYRKRGARSNK
jgi:hypothetical protein